MSAYKTAYIRLGEAEYKRLREAEEQIRFNNLLLSESKKNHEEQQKSIYENMMGIKKHNDRNFQKLVVDLDGEISRIEKEASSWVENQTVRMQAEMEHYQSTLHHQTENHVEELLNQATQQIQQKENALQSFWVAQEERISTYENMWKEYEKQSLNWIYKNQNVLDFMYESYLIDAAMANKLENQREYLNQVIQQYNNGFYDIAANAGFQIYITLSNIHFQLEVDRAIQLIQYQNLQEKLNALLDELDNSHSVHAMDAEGNELPDMIEVDYWVEGRFAEFVKKVDCLVERIKLDDTFDINRIQTYQFQVDEFSNQLTDLITQARVVVLASQLRFNVAQIVVQALESQGFFLEQANYDKGDYRETFVAKTINFAGNEVLVSIDPDPGLDEGGRLNIRSLDADQITEHELIQRNIEIFNAIKENGIEVENIREVKKPQDEQILINHSRPKIFNVTEHSLEEKINHGRH